MKNPLNFISNTWKWNVIVTIGGVLIGVGLADCVSAINKSDLNQIARGLTIFSAGVTILVVMDSTKTQKQTEKVHQDTQLRLEKVEEQMNELMHAQQLTQKQLSEIKELLQQSNSEKLQEKQSAPADSQDENEETPS